MLLLILLFCIFGVLPVLRTNFFALYILQLKEYRRDRIKDFLSTKEWKSALLNKFLMVYSVFFLLYCINFFLFYNNLFFAISWLLIVFLAMDSLYILFKFKKGQLLYPKMTGRILILWFIVFVIQLSVWLWWYFGKHFIISVFVLLVCPYLVVWIAHFLVLPFVKYQKNKIIQKATAKISELESLVSIWITGSFAKSSVKTLLLQLLKVKYKAIWTPKNINTEIWVSQFIIKKLSNNYRYFVAEMWAYRIWEISLLWKIVHHKYGFLTGLWNQHLSLFGSKENIRKWKFEISESVQKEHWKLFVNWDSIDFNTKIPDYVVLYSISNPKAQAYSEIIKQTSTKTEFIFSFWAKSYNLETNLSSKHDLLNLTWVLACVLELGVSIDEVRSELLNLEKPAQTLELKTTKYGLKILDDSYNLSIDWLWAGLEFLNTSDDDKFLVLDDVIELWKTAVSEHKEIWKKLANYDLKKVFLLGKEYSSVVQKSMIESGFPASRIFLRNEISLLKTESSWIALLAWRTAWKFFKS